MRNLQGERSKKQAVKINRHLGINIITATGEDPPTNAPIKLEESGPEGHHDTRDLRRGVITNVSFWELESA